MKDKFNESLRAKAEARLQAMPELGDNPSVEEVKTLVHELRVYQVELEMQNQELREAQERLEASRDRYTDLFEFAPLGYFILDKNGLIVNANLTGCSMLGIERKRLLKKPFALFVAGGLKTVGIFRKYFKEVFQTDTQHILEIKLKRKEKNDFTARLDSVRMQDERNHPTLCRMAVTDITNEERAKKQLEEVLEALEKERSRIAADLHDSINPLLSISKLSIESSINARSPSGTNDKNPLDNAVNMLERAIKEIKAISANLLPTILRDFGIVTALQDLVEKINQSESLQVNLDIHIAKRPNKKIELALFRITQELLNNVLKHAKASKVEVQLIRHRQSIVLMVNDNGKGFDSNNQLFFTNGFGFHNIFSRVKTLDGTVDIDSTIGLGTSVVIEIPLGSRQFVQNLG